MSRSGSWRLPWSDPCGHEEGPAWPGRGRLPRPLRALSDLLLAAGLLRVVLRTVHGACGSRRCGWTSRDAPGAAARRDCGIVRPGVCFSRCTCQAPSSSSNESSSKSRIASACRWRRTWTTSWSQVNAWSPNRRDTSGHYARHALRLSGSDLAWSTSCTGDARACPPQPACRLHGRRASRVVGHATRRMGRRSSEGSRRPAALYDLDRVFAVPLAESNLRYGGVEYGSIDRTFLVFRRARSA